MSESPLPFKPGDWAFNPSGEQIAKVKAVYWDSNLVMFDLVMFSFQGDKLGRVSPSEGGPRSFEPACPAEGWERIAEPFFPIEPRWIPNEDGSHRLRRDPGKRLPPANYVPRKRRARVVRDMETDRLRKALEDIAGGHNDPQTRARNALGLIE